NFGMELYPGPRAVAVDHRRDRRVFAGADDLKIRGCFVESIAVAHPDPRTARHSAEKRVVSAVENQLRRPVLAILGGGDLAAQLVAHQLEAVTNTQDRLVQGPK